MEIQRFTIKSCQRTGTVYIESQNDGVLLKIVFSLIHIILFFLVEHYERSDRLNC